MMTSSQKSKIFGIFQGIFLKFSLNFTESGQKFSTFQGNLNLNECYIIFMASHIKGQDLCLDSGALLKKFHRSSWMSDVLPSATRLFLKCCLLRLSRAGSCHLPVSGL